MENQTLNKQFIANDYADYASAMAAYERLKARGYSDNEITFIMSDETREKYNISKSNPLPGEETNHTLEGTGAGSAIGGIVGASVAAIAAIGTSLIIPGLGLVVAGPIAAAFAGAGVGGLAGGLIGALAGLGMGDNDAKEYEEKVKNGRIVVGVNPKEEHQNSFDNNF